MPKPPIPSRKPPVPPKPGAGNLVVYQPPWESGKAGAVPNATEFRPEDEDFVAHDFSHLSAKTMAIRQLFVLEFVKDFNPKNAMLRLGWKTDHPAQLGNNWLNEPYTQYCLDKFIREAKEEALITRASIIAGLVREANSFGLDSSGASRTAAYRSLAKILGMEIKKVEVKSDSPGVMFIPVMGDADSWGEMAAKQQAKLKETHAA